jgi:hypothetical protein
MSRSNNTHQYTQNSTYSTKNTSRIKKDGYNDE